MTRTWLAAPVSFAAGVLLAACASHASGTSSDDAATATPPSCKATGPGVTGCGPTADSCCTTLGVPKGTFDRSYDGVSTNGASDAFPASVSAFSLDKYEVTVGRYRAFVAAEVAGWRPAAGSGKHAYLTGGGLNDGKEPGWEASWSANLASTSADWASNLACTPKTATWTDEAGADDDKPINCVSWYEAYAFCIWDGGFLPSEAEWNYAASGGSDQRVYPWSSPPHSIALDCDLANYSVSWPTGACIASGATKVGAESPMGDGKWGQSDLAGNVFEWNLDSYASPYASSCSDCANVAKADYRVIRGGSFDGASACLLDALRETSVPEGRRRPSETAPWAGT
jgi:sulfatase modifying factor 1